MVFTYCLFPWFKFMLGFVFLVALPTLWNSLPEHVKLSNSIVFFPSLFETSPWLRVFSNRFTRCSQFIHSNTHTRNKHRRNVRFCETTRRLLLWESTLSVLMLWQGKYAGYWAGRSPIILIIQYLNVGNPHIIYDKRNNNCAGITIILYFMKI